MSLQDLEKAFKLIEENGGGDFEGEKSVALINKAEKALELSFPPTYKKFLSTLGCGDIAGLEFYGLIREEFENSSVPNAIWLTLDERKSGLPKNLVIIGSTGDGLYYALDTDHVNANNEECPVVSYGPEGNTELIADDFGCFLLTKLQSVLN